MGSYYKILNIRLCLLHIVAIINAQIHFDIHLCNAYLSVRHIQHSSCCTFPIIVFLCKNYHLYWSFWFWSCSNLNRKGQINDIKKKYTCIILLKSIKYSKRTVQRKQLNQTLPERTTCCNINITIRQDRQDTCVLNFLVREQHSGDSPIFIDLKGPFLLWRF